MVDHRALFVGLFAIVALTWGVAAAASDDGVDTVDLTVNGTLPSGLADPHSTCYSIGHDVAAFLAAPLYYLGMVVYSILYPVIVIVEFLRSAVGWLYWLLTLLPRLLLFVLGWVLYVVWQILIFIPWLLLKLVLLLGRTVGLIVLILLLLGAIAFAFTNGFATAGIVLGLTALVLGVMVLMFGFSVLLAIVLCPLQLVYGAIMGVGEDMMYWVAVSTLSYAGLPEPGV